MFVSAEEMSREEIGRIAEFRLDGSSGGAESDWMRRRATVKLVTGLGILASADMAVKEDCGMFVGVECAGGG